MQKQIDMAIETLFGFYGWIAFGAMSLAAVLSVIELHATGRLRPEALMQPAYAVATSNRGEELLRREKEETAHSVVSYGETMRSHPISGAQ